MFNLVTILSIVASSALSVFWFFFGDRRRYVDCTDEDRVRDVLIVNIECCWMLRMTGKGNNSRRDHNSRCRRKGRHCTYCCCCWYWCCWINCSSCCWSCYFLLLLLLLVLLQAIDVSIVIDVPPKCSSMVGCWFGCVGCNAVTGMLVVMGTKDAGAMRWVLVIVRRLVAATVEPVVAVDVGAMRVVGMGTETPVANANR